MQPLCRPHAQPITDALGACRACQNGMRTSRASGKLLLLAEFNALPRGFVAVLDRNFRPLQLASVLRYAHAHRPVVGKIAVRKIIRARDEQRRQIPQRDISARIADRRTSPALPTVEIVVVVPVVIVPILTAYLISAAAPRSRGRRRRCAIARAGRPRRGRRALRRRRRR